MIQRSLALLGLLIFSSYSVAAPTCFTSHSTSVEYPPDGCEYSVNLSIVDGLPPGTTIEISALLKDFIDGNFPSESVGGTLGGTQKTFQAVLEMEFTGTGSLAGFARSITMPVGDFFWRPTVDLGPRGGGETQSFLILIDYLSGQIFGDPDFCILSFQSGADLGFANLGGATYINVDNAYIEWSVESVFAFDSRIDFQGCPGSAIEGFAGTTYSSSRFVMGDSDDDGVMDSEDNCVSIANPRQEPSAVNPTCGQVCETSGCGGVLCANH